MRNDDAAITLRITGRLAEELQETAKSLGWSLTALMDHLAAQWAEEARDDTLLDEATASGEYAGRKAADEGTEIQVMTS